MRNKRAGGADGELWDAREIAFLPSFRSDWIEWRGWLPPPEARVRDQVLPNEDLVARRGGRPRPSLPGTRQDLERRRRKALRQS